MKIEGYKIIKEINRGPVATVYLAEQLALERRVFLKVLNKHIHDQPDLLQRFKREARICARLNHPNIVNIFDFGDTGEAFYLTFEYVNGQPLNELLKAHGALPFPVIFFITYEIAKGLHFAHQNGVLHRDIKPANIMIGKEGSVKITDFGLATSADLPNLTIQQAAVGTPAYMSPEQATGKKLDAKSDIFSLGVTVYEMSTGSNPFLGQNVVDTLNHVLSLNPKPVKALREDCPAWFDEIIAHMLIKKPDQRMASLHHLLEHPLLKQNLIDQNQFLHYLKHPESFSTKESAPALKKGSKPVKQRQIITRWLIIALVLVVLFFSLRYVNTHYRTEKRVALTDTLRFLPPDTAKARPLLQPTHPVSSTGKKTSSFSEPATERLTRTDSAPSPSIEMRPVNMGRLIIFCRPWAQVFIDHTFIDTTPLNEPLELKAGTYTLTLKNPNFKTLEQTITIRPGQQDTLVFSLIPQTGTLHISAFPWGKVFIDDSLRGITPLQLKVPAGKHLLTIENPNFKRYSDTLQIHPGEVIEKRIQLKK